MLNQILKLAIVIFIVCFKTNAIAQQSINNNKICANNLTTEIDKIINNDTSKKSHWGILVEKLNSEDILYEINADKYFIPASNVKLLTTAAALLKLGADYRIKTPVYISGKPPNLNTLKIVGKGDPTLTNKDLEKLAQKLKNMGVRQINNLIIEDGYLPPPMLNQTWEWTDLYYYYAVPVNSLILNENTFILSLLPQEINQPLKIELSDPIVAKQWLIKNETFTNQADTTDNITLNMVFQKPVLEFQGNLAINSEPSIWTISIINPNEYFLDSLRRIISEKGISIINTNLISQFNNNYGLNYAFINSQKQLKQSNNLLDNPLILDKGEKEQELLVFESPSLAELVKTTNQDSNNLFAEVLLKTLAVDSTNNNAITNLQTILTELGIEKNNYKIVDGSGLSHQNLATPQVFVKVLKLMANTNYNEIYRQSLAMAGMNGTLNNRFQNTSVVNHLLGKTGTISGVSALSGYLEIPDYEPLVFSIIVNQSPEKSSNLRQTIDEIVMILSKLNKCEV